MLKYDVLIEVNQRISSEESEQNLGITKLFVHKSDAT